MVQVTRIFLLPFRPHDCKHVRSALLNAFLLAGGVGVILDVAECWIVVSDQEDGVLGVTFDLIKH